MKKIYSIPTIEIDYLEEECELLNLSNTETADYTNGGTQGPTGGNGGKTEEEKNTNPNDMAKSSWSLWDDEDW